MVGSGAGSVATGSGGLGVDGVEDGFDAGGGVGFVEVGGVGAAAAGDDVVVAVADEEEIVAGLSEEGILACEAVEGIVTSSSGEEVRVFVAVEGIVAGAAVDIFDALEDVVFAGLTAGCSVEVDVDGVFAGGVEGGVGAIAADHGIVAEAAIEEVITGLSEEAVVA